MISLLAGNLLLDAASVSADASESGYPASRVHDGERGAQWMGPNTATRYLTIDLGAARTVSAWGIAHYQSTLVEVYSSSDGVSYTLRDSANPTTGADAFVHALASITSARYWQIAVSGGGALAPALGELMLGEVIELPTPQVVPDYVDSVVGNVARDYSPAGFSWVVRRGSSRRQFKLGWNAMSYDDAERLRDAYAACEEGLTKLLYVDVRGRSWWVEWIDPQLDVSLSAAVFQTTPPKLGHVATITLLEAL